MIVVLLSGHLLQSTSIPVIPLTMHIKNQIQATLCHAFPTVAFSKQWCVVIGTKNLLQMLSDESITALYSGTEYPTINITLGRNQT